MPENLIHPPGPSKAYDINTSDEAFVKIGELFERYGDVVKIKSESRNNDSYLINNPDYIKHILLKNPQNYKKGLGFERVKMLLGNGVIVSDGVFWRKQRRMIQPAFSRSMIAAQVEMVQRCNLQRLEKWRKIEESGEPIDISFEASDLSLEIILRLLFSDDLDTLLDKIETNPFSFLTEDSERDMRFVLKFRTLMKLLQELIQARRESKKEYNDFLSVFIEARDKDSGEAMTDKELLDEVMTLIIAGHETSAITLTWVWYFMAKNPEVDQAVNEEIIQAGFSAAPGFSDLENLSYIKQVTEEALRVYPPVWLYSRKAIEADQLGEYSIPAGADLFISPYYLHRNKEYWKNPEDFLPQRFGSEEKKVQHKFSYIPFSAGPRRCIGDFFAIVETQIHVGLMAKEFRFELCDDKVPSLEAAINMRAKDPIMLKINKR